MLLNPDEIEAVRAKWYGNDEDGESRLYVNLIDMSAKAQLKKVVEWVIDLNASAEGKLSYYIINKDLLQTLSDEVK